MQMMLKDKIDPETGERILGGNRIDRVTAQPPLHLPAAIP
jgi:hypothetical protein